MAGVTLWACIIAAVAVLGAAVVAITSVLWISRVAIGSVDHVTRMASEIIESGRVFVAPVEHRSAWELEQERKRALAERPNLEAIS